MTILLLLLTGASVFSVGGMGEDMAAFRMPFYGPLDKARLEFTLSPEFDIMTEAGDIRNRFWTNPFLLNFRIPLNKTLALTLGNAERFNQSSDVYLDRDPLTMHLRADGGVDEVECRINANLPIAEFFGGGSYIFGASREVWEYDVGDYSAVDTFQYQYRGRIFSAGLRWRSFGVAYEGLGRVTMVKADADSAFDLPQRLSIRLTPAFGTYKLLLEFEHSLWTDNMSPYRVRLGLSRAANRLAYTYNPWYYNGIQEHGFDAGRVFSIRNIGFIDFDLNVAYRSHGTVKEFKVVPEIKLTLEEIFSRMKR